MEEAMALDLHDTASILIEKEGRFLLIRRGKPPEKGFWAVPGGHVDAGESPYETACRESSEEVGEAMIEKKPFFVFVHDVGIGHRHRAYIFKGSLTGQPQAGSDAAEARWFSIEDMKKVELTHYTKRIFNFMLYGDLGK
jgi:ADP-ribose pyrophosphatase YjhB (NUDIX family)